MSLTTDEREKIGYYLGYPAAADTSGGWGLVLKNGCDRITSTTQLEIVRGFLRNLARVEQLRHNTLPFAAQTFNSGASQGTSQFLPGQRMTLLDNEARHIIGQLANYLQLEIYSDIFSMGGWQSSGIVRG